MGQKVHPTGIRLGISRPWSAVWYEDGDAFGRTLNNDLELRAFLRKRLSHASVSRIQIERPSRAAHITIHTARPGIVIGKNAVSCSAAR